MSAANNQVITNLKNSIKNLIIPYELILTCDKETISSDDNESATVTATLTDKKTSLPVQDELLLYTIYDSDYNLLDHGVLTTDNNGEASVVYVAGGLGDVNVTFSLRTVLQKTYIIEDCYFTMIPDTKVTTSSGDKVIFTINPLDNFILTGDYYPTDTWEWLMIKNADLSDIIGVFSSSYDKSKYFGITYLGYNAWKNITIKLEDNTLTFIYGKTTVTKDVSQYLGQSWNIMVNRANTRFKNLKHKKL